MKQSLENKYTMYLSTLNVLDAHSADFSTVTAFSDAVADLRTFTNQIAEAAQAQETAITGVSSDKRELKETLIDSILDVAGGVKAYASRTENRTLFDEASYTRSDLLRQSDALLPSTAQIIHDAAQTNIAALADYGIAAPKLAALQTAINEYREAVPTPRSAQVLRKSQTELLENLFEQTDVLVKETLDELIKQFKVTNTVFFTDYTNARVIVDTGVRHTSLHGKVTDAATGQPLVGAAVKIIELDRDTLTDISGDYGIKEFKGDIYTVRAEAAGYQPLAKNNIEILRGQNVELNFELAKI